jgi:hypothetical protein
MMSAVSVTFLPVNTAELGSVNLLPEDRLKSAAPEATLLAVRLLLADMTMGVPAPVVNSVVFTDLNVASPV